MVRCGAHGLFSQSFNSVAQHDAFPSEHTAKVFSLAAVSANEYGNHKLVPPIAYTIASAVAVTRLIEHTHWTSDVFLGSAIGYLCGKQVVRHYHDHYSPGEVTTEVSLSMIGETPAINFLVRF